MKHLLLLTTAIGGLSFLVLPSEAQAQAITTTANTIHVYDFPDTAPRSISTSVSVSGSCPEPSNGGDDGEACPPCSFPCCFDYHVRVLMHDGTLKKIGEIKTGDETAYGIVKQTYLRRFDQSQMAREDFQIAYRGGLYEYRGILATGNHVMKENGHWLAMVDLKDVRPAFAPHIENVYNLDIEGGVIPIVDLDGNIIPFLDDKQFLSAQSLVA